MQTCLFILQTKVEPNKKCTSVESTNKKKPEKKQSHAKHDQNPNLETRSLVVDLPKQENTSEQVPKTTTVTNDSINSLLECMDSLEVENRCYKVSQQFYDTLLQKNKVMEKQIKDFKESQLCQICMDKERCVALRPCGHLMSCEACAPFLKNCPICRIPVKGYFKIYHS